MVSWYHCQWWLHHSLFGEMNHHGISFAHLSCKMLQYATRNWSFLKPLKLVRSLRSAVQRSAAKSTYWLIACFCDSPADKIPRQLGLAWTLHCHRLVSGLAYESSGSLVSGPWRRLTLANCVASISQESNMIFGLFQFWFEDLCSGVSLLTHWHAIPLYI